MDSLPVYCVVVAHDNGLGSGLNLSRGRRILLVRIPECGRIEMSWICGKFLRLAAWTKSFMATGPAELTHCLVSRGRVGRPSYGSRAAIW